MAVNHSLIASIIGSATTPPETGTKSAMLAGLAGAVATTKAAAAADSPLSIEARCDLLAAELAAIAEPARKFRRGDIVKWNIASSLLVVAGYKLETKPRFDAEDVIGAEWSYLCYHAGKRPDDMPTEFTSTYGAFYEYGPMRESQLSLIRPAPKGGAS